MNYEIHNTINPYRHFKNTNGNIFYMNHEQFTYWLKGFIEGKLILTQSDIEKVKEKANEIVPEVKWDFAQPSPYTAPIVPYDGTINPNPIWCGTSISNGDVLTNVSTANAPYTYTKN
jgi:hypothetical protein